MKLFEIAAAYRSLADRIDSYEDIPEDLEAQLVSIESSMDDKFEGCCALRREFEAQANAAREEAKRLNKLVEVSQHAADRIWNYLAANLATMGLQQYRTPRFHAYFQKNTPKCEVLTPEELPQEYQRITVEADKKLLVQHWKDGIPLPYGVQVTQGTSLRLK